jgi:hypothetical protein
MAQAPTGHVYRMRWWFRAFALFFLAFGSVLFTDKALKTVSASEDPDFTKLALVLIFPAVGAGMTAKSFSSTVKFTESTVERRSVFGFQNVSLAAIRGRREYVVRGNRGVATRYLRLVATDNSFVDFGKSLYTFDDAFWVWFRQLPDLDAEDANRAKSNFGLV